MIRVGGRHHHPPPNEKAVLLSLVAATGRARFICGHYAFFRSLPSSDERWRRGRVTFCPPIAYLAWVLTCASGDTDVVDDSEAVGLHLYAGARGDSAGGLRGRRARLQHAGRGFTHQFNYLCSLRAGVAAGYQG